MINDVKLTLRDHDIRTALRDHLSSRYGDDPETLIRHELGLCANTRRADVAVINGEFIGFEIKSDRDTLTRLAGQVETYGLVFDRATMIATDRHLSTIMGTIPEWWGVIIASRDGHMVDLRELRAPGLNENQQSIALAKMLWHSEVLEILRARDLHRGLARKTRWFAWQRLAENLSLVELRQVVRDRLKARKDWPGGQ